MRTTIPLVTVALLLVAPLAASQVPETPTATPIYRVEIQNAPAAFTGLDVPNATATAPFQVVLTLGNVVCPADETIAVAVTAEAAGAPAFFSVMTEPSVLNFTIAVGPHGAPPVGQAAGGTGDSAVRATIAGNITANASVPVTVTATAPAPSGCAGAGTISGATSEPVTIYANMTAPPAPPAEPTPEEDTPFVGVLAIAAVGALVALARRRRS